MADKQAISVGVDLGGTNMSAGVLKGDKLLNREKKKTKADEGPEKVIKRLVKLVEDVIDDAKADRKDVRAVGVGAPGAINPETGEVIKAVNLRWDNLPLAKELEKALDLPVVVDNDVNVGAWGEFRAGAGKKHDELLAVFVGTGIGGGLVLNGRLYHGTMGTAGEIGHTLAKPDAPLGRRTLENLASRTAMVNLITQLIESNHGSVITEITDGDLSKVRSKVLAEAVKRDDPLATRVIREAAGYVGSACADVVTLLSLPCVVIGGGMAEAMGKTYVKWVREAFDEHVFPPDLKDCEVVVSELGDDAGVVGAALLALDRLEER